MNISIILGSIRDGRQSHKIANYLHTVLSKIPDIQAVFLDLLEYDLPLLTDIWSEQDTPVPQLKEFGKLLMDADAFIFISPEYHGSYTGVLKNAVDHYWKEFKRKPIGVVATGSGKMGGINASTELQLLILSLGAFPMPQKLLVPNIKTAFDDQHNPSKSELEKDVQKFVEEFIWFAQAIHNSKK